MRMCVHFAILSTMILLAASFSGPGYPACVSACVAAAASYAGTAATAVGASASTALGGATTVAGVGATAGASAGAGAAVTAAGAGAAGAGAVGGAAVGAAGAAAVAVPVVVIGTTAAAGSVLAGCAAACLCFDQSVSVTTRNGSLPITDVKVGDEVLTLDDTGHDKYTSVLNTFRIHSDVPFEFVKIQTGPATISVTKTHPIIVKLNGESIVKEAGAVKVGDAMVQQGATTTPVTSTSTFTDPTKYLIHTHEGTVLAGGLLVKTLGGNELPEHMQAGRLQIGDVQAFINQYDGDGNNTLSFEEFMASTLSKEQEGKFISNEIPEFLGREFADVQAKFRYADVNNNAGLNREEYAAAGLGVPFHKADNDSDAVAEFHDAIVNATAEYQRMV